MSALMLRQSTKPHDIFDDLESLLWVLLFTAVRNFKYNGFFDMQVFKEGQEVANEEFGVVTLGGSWKYSWIHDPEITFECKPLQDFFDSFRDFHRERFTKHILANGSEEDAGELERFEAEVCNDVYNLLSHFDNILNDPDADWTGQETHRVSQKTCEEPGQDASDSNVTDGPRLAPLSEVRHDEATRGAKKRKRGSEDNNEDRRKRIAISHDDNARANLPATRAPRRRRAPIASIPSNRTLRPRTHK